MKIKNAIILCAGYGNRLRPLTKTTPKPLIKIKKMTLLENTINFLCSIKVKKIFINTHYLSDQIRNFFKNKKFEADIKIINERKILNTGGGALNVSKKIKKDEFFVINPDTIWSRKYKKDFYKLEKAYFYHRKAVMLLVSKKKSFDKSFKGDFNFNKKKEIFKTSKNEYIYTGAQLVNRSFFKEKKIKPFPMSIIWKKLIKERKILAVISNNKFFHVNNLKTYKKICKKKLLI